MSTIVTSNVSDGTLSIPTTYVTNGSAKAWVNFNGTGTIAARDSLNVSSLTDNGVGLYTANWSNAFALANYALALSSSQNETVYNAAPTTTAAGLASRNSSGTSADASFADIWAIGDLA